MKEKIDISIITPCFNPDNGAMKGALSSVFIEGPLTYEHLVIDDGSSEADWSLVSNLISPLPNVSVCRLNENSGPAVARNKGIELAKGRYIAFLDADDIWHPDKLKKQITFMQEAGTTLCYTAYEIIDQQGNIIGCRSVPKTLTYKDLLKCNQIGCSTAIYDTKLIGKQYFENLRRHEDLTLWLKIAKTGAKIAGLQEPLVQYRVGASSVSSNKWKVLKYQWKIYRECEKLGFFTSVYYFIHYAINGLKNHYFTSPPTR
ncbi:glycosyltransferase [Vibrio sp. JC009]|uniref:glycosyltransferase family 2 protein n=1 Tax=Vibrio sp. JC009 TaxID=2912314 RepID=UPI0023AE99A6|nr:glycosyltransferase family 2 protein [Vibrio sp. JC009]WED22038.1 glycosyltransferase [Vibrio sp. JC009]